jgi:hypothetical protein
LQYHELLNSLSDEDWKKESGNPAWSVGQLMWHLARGTEFVSEVVGKCRRGKAQTHRHFLTPIFALETDTNTAVAAVSIPHFAATAVRLWRDRGQRNRRGLGPRPNRYRLIGTVAGAYALRRVPEALFQRLVSALILALGEAMLISVFV